MQVLQWWQNLGELVAKLWQGAKEAFLFLGHPAELLFSALDIFLLSMIFYFILRIVRDSRAWQLLKGVFFILLLGLLSNFVGLNALGYLLYNTISVFAIAFVVIFQPELRRALETVGRSGFHVLSLEDTVKSSMTSRMIESIVQACDEMASKRTGALLVIQRSTPLGDLESQENAVPVDSLVSATILKQIFYVGSPLHDGACLIRGGRVTAARIHIPLSDTYHLRRDLGTRHRAAIGASEIGDAIAIAVSEERGVISIAFDGRLYGLDNSDALRTQLHRLLMAEDAGEGKPKKRLALMRMGKQARAKNARGQSSRQRLALVFSSVFLACAFWLYVQMTINPIRQQSYQVPLLYEQSEALEEKGLTAVYRMENIRIQLSGRDALLKKLRARDITAYVDLSELSSVGIHSVDVKVRTNSAKYTRTDSLLPGAVVVKVREQSVTTPESATP